MLSKDTFASASVFCHQSHKKPYIQNTWFKVCLKLFLFCITSRYHLCSLSKYYVAGSTNLSLDNLFSSQLSAAWFIYKFKYCWGKGTLWILSYSPGTSLSGKLPPDSFRHHVTLTLTLVLALTLSASRTCVSWDLDVTASSSAPSAHLLVSQGLNHFLDAEIQVADIVLLCLHEFCDDFHPLGHHASANLLFVLLQWSGRGCRPHLRGHFFCLKEEDL